ncbi:MAG: type II toxin-antitoxin system RelE/ParE family toxin [Bacteroidota bacterium]
MTVVFRKSFLRDLKKLKDPTVRARVRAVIEAVEAADALADLPDVKKMSGSSGFYRVRLGAYRIGLAVDGDEVEFVRVLGRKDIYRYFP